MVRLTLYGLETSPPTRSCLLVLKALELQFDLVQVNLQVGENMLPEFLQRNPQHTVPVLEDGQVCIWDSHAIMAYLVRVYGQTDTLYPREYDKRVIVDQRLHFDSGVIFTSLLLPITKGLLYFGNTTIERYKIDAIVQVFNLVENFLANNDYIAGPNLTIADFSYVCSICCLVVYLELDSRSYPRMVAWLKRLKELPYYEEAQGAGEARLEAMIKSTNFTVEALCID